MKERISKQSEIKIKVDLNSNNLPIQMNWSASDGGIENQNASAFLLSIWNPEEKNTMKSD